MKRSTTLALLLCWLAGSQSAPAQYRLEHLFTPGDSEVGDLFGSSVELSGNLAVVRSRTTYAGAPGGPPNQTHLFRHTTRVGWEETQVISLDGTGVWTGHEVALDGDDLVLGMSSNPNWEDGSLNFFSRDGDSWAPAPVSRLPDPMRPIDRASPEVRDWRLFNGSRRFGRSVEADGGFAIVGAPDTPWMTGAEERGAALIYRRNVDGWEEQAALPNPGGAGFDDSYYGHGVALSGGVAAVASGWPRKEAAGVAIYERSDLDVWQLTARLSTPVENDQPDWILDLVATEETVVGIDLNGTLPIFEKQGDGSWAFSTRLRDVPSTPHCPWCWVTIDHQRTILSADIEGDLIAAGVLAGKDSHVQLYRRDADRVWRLTEVIPAPDPATAEGFGYHVAIDRGRVLVGASRELREGFAGAAYLFAPVPEPSTACLAIAFFASAIGARPGSTRRA